MHSVYREILTLKDCHIIGIKNKSANITVKFIRYNITKAEQGNVIKRLTLCLVSGYSIKSNAKVIFVLYTDAEPAGVFISKNLTGLLYLAE